METADVVIIGSGIVGSSVAYHLAQAGCTNVLVIEREAHQGKGSTGKSMGGVRAQFSTPVNIQMSRYSIDFFSRFDDVVGHPADYRAHGYLFCATSESHLAYLQANRERQIGLGVNNVEWVSPEEIKAIVPQMRTDDILGGTFCPTDGFVEGSFTAGCSFGVVGSVDSLVSSSGKPATMRRICTPSSDSCSSKASARRTSVSRFS